MQPLEYFLTDSHQYSEENNTLYNYLIKHLSIDLVKEIAELRQDITDQNELILLIFNKAYEMIAKIESDACPQIHVEHYFLNTSFELAEYFKMPDCRNMIVPMTLTAHAMCIAYGIMGLPYYDSEIKNGEGPKVLTTMYNYDYTIHRTYYEEVTFKRIFQEYRNYLFRTAIWERHQDCWSIDEPEDETQEQEDEEIAPDTPIDEQVILQIGQGKNIREVLITAARVVQCVKDSGHKSKLSNTEWEKLLSNITSISEKSFHRYW